MSSNDDRKVSLMTTDNFLARCSSVLHAQSPFQSHVAPKYICYSGRAQTTQGFGLEKDKYISMFSGNKSYIPCSTLKDAIRKWNLATLRYVQSLNCYIFFSDRYPGLPRSFSSGSVQSRIEKASVAFAF